MNNEELIAALEAADGPSRDLMLEAFAAHYPDDGTADYGDRLFRFVAMLNAEAWESAALMLVPEGWHWSTNSGGTARIWVQGVYYAAEAENAAAATPALAICIAALKAGGEG